MRRVPLYKLTPPTATPPHVQRPLLFADHAGVPLSRLTLIEAPAGYGKTTLCGQWWTRQKEQGYRVIWISFDDLDQNFPEALDTYLNAAFSENFTNSLDVDRMLTGPFSSEKFVDEVQETTILFLDNLHLIDANAAVEKISELLHCFPNNFYIVAASRSGLGQRLENSEIASSVLLKGRRDLSFSEDEIRAVMGENTPDAVVLTLTYRLQGWPALVRVLHGVARNWPGSNIDFTLSDHSVEDAYRYLLEEIYQRLTSRQQAVLHLAAMVLNITSSIVDEILGSNDGTGQLLEIEKNYGLIEQIQDPDGLVYRMHELLRRFVQTCPVNSLLGTLKQTQTRLSYCFERAGDLPQAIFHAVEARDRARAIELLCRAGGWNTALHIGSGTLNQLYSLFKEEFTEQPQIELAAIYDLLQSSRIAEARHRLNALQHTLSIPSNKVSEHLQSIMSECLVLDLLTTHYEGKQIDLDRIDRLHSSLTLSGRVNKHVLVILENHIRALAYYDAGDYEQGLRWAQSATAVSESNSIHYAQVYALTVSGLCCFRLGRMKTASEFMRKAEFVSGLRLHGAFLQRHQTMIQIFSAMIDWEINDDSLSEIEIDSIETRVLNGYDGWPPVFLAFYASTSEIKAQTMGVSAAINHIARAISVAKHQGWSRIANELDIRMAIIYLATGEGTAAQKIISDFNHEQIDAKRDPHIYELLVIAQGWIKISNCEYQEAIDILESAMLLCNYNKRGLNGISILVLKVIALALNGKKKQAKALLNTVLALEPNVYKLRCFKRFHSLGVKALATDWPSLKENNKKETLNKTNDRLSDLTIRERETLELVAAGYSAKEIARRLSLTPNTVTWYRKHAYQKLGISKRCEATMLFQETP